MKEFGMVTTSFFGVRIRVTSGFLYYIAGSIIQLDAVAQLERTHIGYDQSRNDIADNRTGTQRNDQADKDRDSLEYSDLEPGR